MSPAVRSALRSLRAALDVRFAGRVRDVRLFGSFARGEATEDSDVDVLVVVDALTDAEIGLVATEGARVAAESALPIAPLPIATERLEHMRRDGRLLARVLDEEGVAP